MAEDAAIVGMRQLLQSSTAVTALVGERVRPFGKLKQNEVLPAITLFRLSARRWRTYGSVSEHVNPQVQLDVYAATEAEAMQVAEAARAAVQDGRNDRIRGTFLATERDWYEEATESFRVLMQWDIHHTE